LVFAAGCGGSGGTSSAASAAGTSAAPSASTTGKAVDGKVVYTEYVSCLVQHGIPMPTGTPAPTADPNAPKPTGPQLPGGGPPKPSGVADDAWAAANAACKYLIPTIPTS
jgi:hypothetical protein